MMKHLDNVQRNRVGELLNNLQVIQQNAMIRRKTLANGSAAANSNNNDEINIMVSKSDKLKVY